MNLKRRCLQSSKELLEDKNLRLIDNGAKILGVAHVDYRDCNIGHKFQQFGDFVFNTRLDDRLGVHILLDLLPKCGVNCDVLLTDDEEMGMSTAQYFETDKKYNWMFQFDRRGKDAVVYEYEEMIPYVNQFFEPDWGSFSDISFMEHLGCGGFNVGTGYNNEHCPTSYANLAHTYNQIAKFVEFYDAYQFTYIEHIEQPKVTVQNLFSYHSNDFWLDKEFGEINQDYSEWFKRWKAPSITRPVKEFNGVMFDDTNKKEK
jgi:hypothetical protein